MGLLCRIANDTARNSPAAPQARRQTVEKRQRSKRRVRGKSWRWQSHASLRSKVQSHAANAAKKGVANPFFI